MVKQFKVETIVKKCDSPCIITLNENHQLIGNLARSMENYIRKGFKVQATGHVKGNDFLVEKLFFLDGVVKGVQINKYA